MLLAKLYTNEAIPLTPVPSPPNGNGGEGRVNRNLLLPLPWGEGGRRPGEGVAADGARVFSVDGVVQCIIWVLIPRFIDGWKSLRTNDPFRALQPTLAPVAFRLWRRRKPLKRLRIKLA